jgi:hypothetical protein
MELILELGAGSLKSKCGLLSPHLRWRCILESVIRGFVQIVSLNTSSRLHGLCRNPAVSGGRHAARASSRLLDTFETPYGGR